MGTSATFAGEIKFDCAAYGDSPSSIANFLKQLNSSIKLIFAYKSAFIEPLNSSIHVKGPKGAELKCAYRAIK